MKFGIVLPTFCGGVRGSEVPKMNKLAEFAEKAEESGFDSVWVIEHLLVAEPIYRCTWYDPLITLAAIASRTSRVKLGTSILVLPLRNPAILAKTISTLDVISEGRVILGVGNGWWEKEFEACGVPFNERGARSSEYIDILKKLWTGENVEHEGRFFKFKNITIEPKPIQKPHPPIWIAGGSAAGKAEKVYKVKADKVLKRIATKADGWIARAVTLPELIMSDWERIRKYALEAGRNPDGIVFAHLNFVHLIDETDTSYEGARRAFSLISNLPFDNILNEYIVGPKRTVFSRLDKLAELKLQYMIVWPTGFDYKLIDFFEKEVMPTYG